MKIAGAAAVLLLISVSFPADAREHRSSETTRLFQLAHPCPSTGRKTGACPGWIKDHIVPLCKHGADLPSNMQWQTVEAAKAKDRWECKAAQPRGRTP